jgi:hypothetical protein
MLRNRTSRLGAAIGAALLSFSLAAPALADHRDDWRRDGYRRGYTGHRHGDYCDHDYDGRWDRGWRRHWDRDWDRREHRWHGGRAYYGRDHRHAYHYGCRRCNKRWRDQDHFHRHLIQHHHVPYYAIPQAVVFAGWGWDFRD